MNAQAGIAPALEGVELKGHINTDESTLLAHIAHSVRLGHPQVRQQPIQADRVCIVGGGPSLAETDHELRELYYQGAKLVTVNGAYHWCLERNFRPSAHIVMDARATNARFMDPAIPQCKYLIASQCHPDTWARLNGRDNVWIWHACAGEEGAITELLKSYYGERWTRISGGTTVALRALAVLRTLGFIRMDLFGIDSCYLDGQGHAYPQPENDTERLITIDAHPSGHPELVETFRCSPWHLQQLSDFLQMIKVNGEHFLLNIHGRGLLAMALRSYGALVVRESGQTA